MSRLVVKVEKACLVFVVLVAYTLLSGCAIARLALPRSAAVAAQRTATFGLSRAVAMPGSALRFGRINYATTATAGRATAIAHFRSLHVRGGGTETLRIVSQNGRVLGRAIKTGKKIEVKTIESGRERLLMYSIRERNKVFHYNSFHRRVGYSRISASRNRVDHYTNAGDSLGYDIVSNDSAVHHDWKGRRMSKSRLAQDVTNAVRIFKAGSRFENIMEAYSRSVVYTDNNVSRLFDDYMNAQERCFQPTHPNREQCELLPILYGQLKKQIESNG